MIVIDVDALKNQARKNIVISALEKHVTKHKHPELGDILVPKTPIYWMTTNPSIKKMYDVEKVMGCQLLGTLWNGKSVLAMLKLMVKRTDEFYIKTLKMKSLKRFRRPVEVLTDHDYNEISKLNATPLPLGILS